MVKVLSFVESLSIYMIPRRGRDVKREWEILGWFRWEERGAYSRKVHSEREGLAPPMKAHKSGISGRGKPLTYG